jgi:hypothetical protein
VTHSVDCESVIVVSVWRVEMLNLVNVGVTGVGCGESANCEDSGSLHDTRETSVGSTRNRINP